jgi:hypothetical protein
MHFQNYILLQVFVFLLREQAYKQLKKSNDHEKIKTSSSNVR